MNYIFLLRRYIGSPLTEMCSGPKCKRSHWLPCRRKISYSYHAPQIQNKVDLNLKWSDHEFTFLSKRFKRTKKKHTSNNFLKIQDEATKDSLSLLVLHSGTHDKGPMKVDRALSTGPVC